MTTLYVYKSDDDKEIDSHEPLVYYRMGRGKLTSLNSSLCLNNVDEYNRIALLNKDAYSEYIYSLHTEWQRKDLIHTNDLSLYFLSDISNKRTELFDTYHDICHVLYVSHIVEERQIREIKLVGCTHSFFTALSSRLPQCRITAGDCLPDSAYSFFRYVLSSFRFSCTCALVTLLVNVFRFPCMAKEPIQRLFFSVYPQHINADNCDIKYMDLVTSSDTTLFSVLMDGMHQNLSLTKYFRSLKTLKKIFHVKRCLLLDAHISCMDIVCQFIFSLRLWTATAAFSRRFFLFERIDISSYMKKELITSRKRIPRLLMYENALKRIFSSTRVHSFYYYLHEFCFGRMLSYCVERYAPQTERIGFQHGPAARRKLVYAMARGEAESRGNYREHVPIPDRVLCEDRISKDIYEGAGYHAVSCMPTVYRLSYLTKIVRHNVDEKCVLIACGLHDAEELVSELRDVVMSKAQYHFIIKVHPKVEPHAVSRIIGEWNAPNVSLGSEPTAYYLSFVGSVICSYSSLGTEARMLGIPVQVISLYSRINESQLCDVQAEDNEKVNHSCH